MQVIKRITSTYKTILRAKIYFFFKKSLWLYLLSMVVFAYVSPLPTFGILTSAIIYFLIFIVAIILPLYHFSAVRLAKQMNIDADAEFNENNIVLRHRNKDFIETKDWSWIANISFTNAAVLLQVNQANRFVIFLDKNKLTADELAFFTEIKKTKNL